jgi:MFS family permease
MIGGILVGVVVSLVISQKLGYKPATILGLVMIATASVLATRTTIDSGYGWTGLWLTVFGFGFGAIMISGQNLALSQLDEAHAGAGVAIVQVMRQTGGVVGIAVLISVLNSVYRGQVDVTGLPEPVGRAVQGSFQAGLAVAERLTSAELAGSVKNAFVEGMHAEMWFSVGLALATAGLVFLAMPRWLGKMDTETHEGMPDDFDKRHGAPSRGPHA